MPRGIIKFGVTAGIRAMLLAGVSPVWGEGHVLGGRLTVFVASAEYPAGKAPERDLEVGVALLRSTEGEIVACEAPDDSKVGAYGSASCKIARRLSPTFLRRKPKVGRIPITIIWSAPKADGPNDDGASYVYLPYSITADDYPPDSAFLHQGGNVKMRLTVSAEGLPTGCEIVVSSGFSALDDRSCRIAMTKIRFIAPLDEHGQPRVSHPVRQINWTANH